VTIRYWLDEMLHYDPGYALFGSSRHRYRLAPPIDAGELGAIEDLLGVRLPHRDFLLHVGNGGAGPYYGVAPLTAAVLDDPALGRPFLLTEAWEPPDDDYSDDVFDGLLFLADHGCSYQSYLVVSGPAAGQVWWDFTSVGEELGPEAGSFEEWYAHWLGSSRRQVCDHRIRSIVRHEPGWSVDDRLLALRTADRPAAPDEPLGTQVFRLLSRAHLAVYRRDLAAAREILATARATPTDIDMSVKFALVEAVLLREEGRTADALSTVDEALGGGMAWADETKELRRLRAALSPATTG